MMNEVISTGVLASRCRRFTIGSGSDGIKINGIDETSRASNLWGGIMVYMTDEAGTVTATKPKFRRIEMNLHKMMGICYLTDELMRDATALEGFIVQGFTSAFRFKLDDQIFQGSGAGECLGLMNSGCLVTVDKESGQAAATILAENIVKMYSRRFASQTGNYVWLYNQSIEPQLFTMSLAVGTGGIPIYMPAGGLSDAPYARLMGLPAIAIEHTAALGTTGDIVLANLTDGYLLAEKGGIRQDVSIHVQFLYDEQILRFIARFDGQPWRASALTPYKGGSGATQSHFVALETRS
jgi:HK97 family phage major capsid protein